MSKFSDLPENASPTNDDIVAIEQDSDGLNRKVKLGNIPIVSELASQSNGEGASKVAIEDAGANFASTDVEGALAELYAMLDGLDSWQSGTTYTAGQDAVILNTNNRIYRCIVTNSDVSFDPAKWQAVGKDAHTIADDSVSGSNATLTAPSDDIIRLTNGSLVSIDMIPAGETGNPIWLINRTGNTITINDETGGTAADRILTGSGSNLSVDDNTSVQMIYDSTESRWQVVGGLGGGSSLQIAILQEESNSNLASSANTVHTRNLNSQYGDTSIITNLSSSQFTIEAGEYYADCIAFSYRSAYSTLFLYNVTDGVYVDTVQPNTYNWPSTNIFIPTHCSHRFSIASQKVFELRHYINAGDADGLGNSGYLSTNNPATTNVYSKVNLMKIG